MTPTSSPLLPLAGALAPAAAPASPQAAETASGTPFRQVLARERQAHAGNAPHKAEQAESGQPAQGVAGQEAPAGAQAQAEAAGARGDDGTADSEAEAAARTGSSAEDTQAAALAQFLALAAQQQQLQGTPPAPRGGSAAEPAAAARDIAGAAGEAGAARLPAPVARAAQAPAVPEEFPAAVLAAQEAGRQAALPLEENAVQPAAALAALDPAQAVLRQAAALPAAPRLAPAVGSHGWDQALGQRVIWMAGVGQHSAELSLNPPDLGPLQVVLNVSDSQATANFFAPQPEVRQALEAAMPRLRDMLGAAGIELGQASVSDGSARQPGTGGDMGGNRRRQGGGTEAAAATLAPAADALRQAGIGLVNTFA